MSVLRLPAGAVSRDPIDIWNAAKAALHDRQRVKVIVDEQKVAAQLGGGDAGRAASGEEVENQATRIRRGADDPPQNGERLLGRVAGLLLAGRTDDCVPPDVGWQLATFRLLRSDESRSQVWLTVDIGGVKDVVTWVLDVDEDRIVL